MVVLRGFQLSVFPFGNGCLQSNVTCAPRPHLPSFDFFLLFSLLFPASSSPNSSLFYILFYILCIYTHILQHFYHSLPKWPPEITPKPSPVSGSPTLAMGLIVLRHGLFVSCFRDKSFFSWGKVRRRLRVARQCQRAVSCGPLSFPFRFFFPSLLFFLLPPPP